MQPDVPRVQCWFSLDRAELNLGHAAVHTDFAAVHEGAVIGGEKQRLRCDLI
jgi:hypothetical protein